MSNGQIRGCTHLPSNTCVLMLKSPLVTPENDRDRGLAAPTCGVKFALWIGPFAPTGAGLALLGAPAPRLGAGLTPLPAFTSASTWSICIGGPTPGPCNGDGPLSGGEVALLLPVGSIVRVPSNDAGLPTRLGPALSVPGGGTHATGGRIGLFAGMLFCGSVLKVMGTGPRDIDRSNSSRP